MNVSDKSYEKNSCIKIYYCPYRRQRRWPVIARHPYFSTENEINISPTSKPFRQPMILEANLLILPADYIDKGTKDFKGANGFSTTENLKKETGQPAKIK